MLFLLYLKCLLLFTSPIHCLQSQNLLQAKFPDTRFVQYDLEKFINNKGFGPDGNLDDLGNHFVCDLPAAGNSIQIGTIPYTITEKRQRDNVYAQGQVITINASLGALYLLVTASHGPIRAQIVVTYQDGSTSSTLLQVPDWVAPKITTYDAIPCKVNTGATGYLLSMPVYIDPAKPVSHLTLPYASGTLCPTLHIFGLTGVTSTVAHVVSAVATSDFEDDDDEQQGGSSSSRYQYINVRVHNTGTQWLADINVEISGPLLETKQPGKIVKLAPGSISRARVLIHTLHRKPTRTAIIVRLYKDENLLDEQVVTVNVGLGEYNATRESLSHHGPPKWYQDAKFGIFIHWGVYSVPAYAPPYQYAEWYWYQMHQVDGPTYHFHQDTYGTSFEYDDFIQQWDPSDFDATNWLQLVNASQATYFVFTTKHHDGIALFDTKVTERSSVHFKGWDFAKEIFDAAKGQYPHLKRGLYFSMPEWYHPSYHDSWLGWHGPPLNPFTGAQAPYIGAPPVEDFVNDVQVPQALELIDNYQPDIFWCDIGGINNSSVWQSHYFNSARSRGKQVVINDRCGNGIWDFATVEYREVFDPPPTSWESTRGIDPFSFGYNRATSLDRYTSTTALIQELVNVVAKGGNFLLNIGPEASGRVPHVMVDRLLGIGQWLQTVHPSIFDSEPYWVTPEDDKDPGQHLRFMVKRDGTAFYIFSLYRPIGERVFVKAPVPYIHPRMQVSLLADRKIQLKYNVHSNGRLVLHVPNSVLDRAKHVWVFEIIAP